MLQWALMLLPYYILLICEVHPIFCCIELRNASYAVCHWTVKFCPVFVPLIYEILSILCCSVLWCFPTLCFSEVWSSQLWSSFLYIIELWSSSHPVFHWVVKFFSSCVPASCEVLLNLCSSELWNSSHSVFPWAVKFFLSCVQWAVKPGFSCQDLSCMVRSSSYVCLSVCLW